MSSCCVLLLVVLHNEYNPSRWYVPMTWSGEKYTHFFKFTKVISICPWVFYALVYFRQDHHDGLQYCETHISSSFQKGYHPILQLPLSNRLSITVHNIQCIAKIPHLIQLLMWPITFQLVFKWVIAGWKKLIP